MEYEVLYEDDASAFAVGSELVPLDEPLIVRFQQCGYFPLLRPLIPMATELDVLITRDLVLADKWVREREKEDMKWIGYVMHERQRVLKRGRQLAYTGEDSIPSGQCSLI